MIQATLGIDRVALATDFGAAGPYVGQMRLCLSGLIRQIPVVEMISDLVPFRPELAAYLLPALVRAMPARSLYLCVVDPGVGGERAALAIQANGEWYIGPDNGLLAMVARRAEEVQVLRVDWRPARLSYSFHGRDLFAPVAAMLCDGTIPPCTRIDRSEMVGSDWPDDMYKVIYADGYGNLITGLRTSGRGKETVLRAAGRDVPYARTFCEVPMSQPFWYENAFGLIELAASQGSARLVLGLGPGDPVQILSPVP